MTQPARSTVTPLAMAQPSTGIMKISPTMAANWLEHNGHNRRLDEPTVAMFVRLIQAGRWALTNDAVTFAPDGTILNGQHRLTAIVRTGVTCSIAVMRNVAMDSQVHMDTGKKRSAGDHLAILGYRNYVNLAAVARVALHYATGTLINETNHKLSNDELVEFIATNTDLIDASEQAVKIRAHLDAPVSVVGCVAWLFRQVDPDDAERFLDAWTTGAGLDDGSPVLALTARLREIRRNKRKVTRAEYLALIIRAWNLWRTNKTVAGLPLRARASGPVEIPEPQ